MRYAEIFNKRGIFVPFMMSGDPSYALSFEIVKTLIDAGADALELGFAFSDPMADGVVIQASHLRALKAGVDMRSNFNWLSQIRDYNAKIPIGLLVYANLIYHFGIENFYRACFESGVDSVLVADVPLIESQAFLEAAYKYQISPVFIAAPHTKKADLERIATLSQAYIYVLARAGVTGAKQVLGGEAKEVIFTLKQCSDVPCLLGFGISKPDHMQRALAMGADGVICGSAVVQIIEEHLNSSSMLTELQRFSQTMLTAVC
ncbi:tryptophan synthase subunit alpha [Helicobacter suis]|uniref:Tryptophan synthase alpha chain n=2 Tax=Helicobacter suis TaxID=104628 RepID=E7G488_9HELI|nr:tryptophan synthase subunit alpha [Helicobacter suis]EFX41810.1 tryptophan synthase subunit alpha [Helicobacter suis HS5]EFX42624.1 tryptophan synthase subunit alpha [Helicobacter suis HS1]BCD45602.1 Tryptophan synthase subunit alpha TrpA [Helicobacter suis]BCD47301.1 Tryptophan synthase subunit alpha TrpA [Helicobacter suis]BCD49055.1 Tryptophan synthase subunit alpha TrpA [Helicobacter suis]